MTVFLFTCLLVAFTVAHCTFVHEQVLELNDPQQNDVFGRAVAISGSAAVVGARGRGEEHGSVTVFRRGDESWRFEVTLEREMKVDGDLFGHSVAMDGNHLLVGVLGANTMYGAVDCFKYNQTTSVATWTSNGKFLPDGRRQGDRFGYALSLQRNRALASADQQDTAFEFDRTGYVLYYALDGKGDSKWSQEPAQRLVATDARDGDRFGSSVALFGDRALIGAVTAGASGTGAAYLFELTSDGEWNQKQALLPTLTSGDEYGSSVALSETFAVVGAMSYTPTPARGAGGGAVFIFEPSQVIGNEYSSWHLTSQLTGDARSDEFGRSLAFSGSILLVGAPLAQRDNYHDRGVVTAYKLVRDEQPLAVGAIDSVTNQADVYFGRSVAADGHRVVVGAFGTVVNSAPKAGAAEIFRWEQDDAGAPTTTTSAAAATTTTAPPVVVVDNEFISSSTPESTSRSSTTSSTSTTSSSTSLTQLAATTSNSGFILPLVIGGGVFFLILVVALVCWAITRRRVHRDLQRRHPQRSGHHHRSLSRRTSTASVSRGHISRTASVHGGHGQYSNLPLRPPTVRRGNSSSTVSSTGNDGSIQLKSRSSPLRPSW